jgi:hypothetical protein
MEKGIKMSNLDKLREVAKTKEIAWRSCWNCNPSHEHLKKEKGCVILCIECGHYYYSGVDITTVDQGEKDEF